MIKPIVAVTEFENRANFSGQWNLGMGFADVLSSELIETRRVVVLERRNLGDVVSEIARQGSDLFRREGRVDRGRLRNARYLLRGVITDFTVTGDVSGWFRSGGSGGWLGGSSARVSLSIKISDVETGEILDAVRTDASARSGFFGGSVDYRGLNFGGDAFFRTPLGRATEVAIVRAVKQVLKAVPSEYWTPCVAEIVDGAAVINGGENVEMEKGTEWVAREPGRPIHDPITGDVIETLPGRETGRVRVTEVRAATSWAAIVAGTVRPGSRLEPLASSDPATGTSARSAPRTPLRTGEDRRRR
jgi:curli biogenesis system outer membrane secretion channel CsgG